MAEVQGPNGGGHNIDGEGIELVVGQDEHGQAGGPLRHIRYLPQFVVSEV